MSNNDSNENKTQTEICLRNMKIMVWAMIGSFIISAFILYFFYSLMEYQNSFPAVTLTTIAYLSLLIGIPLALKYYSIRMSDKNFPHDVSELAQCTYANTQMIIRTNIVGLIFLLNVFTYSDTGDRSCLFSMGIALIALLFFCQPNTDEVRRLIQNQ